MAKISRPVLYTVVLAVVGYGVFILTEPTPPPKKKKNITRVVTAKKEDGISPEDLKAKFPRYQAKMPRDPFLPRVVAVRSLNTLTAGAPPAISVARPLTVGKNGGSWVLTGISAINARKSALVENGATGESVFLTVGEQWNGLRVSRIGDESVLLVDGRGQQTTLSFPEPPDPTAPGSAVAPAGTAPGSNVPGASPVVVPQTGTSRVAGNPAGGGNGI